MSAEKDKDLINIIRMDASHHELVTQDKAVVSLNATVKADSAAKAQEALKKRVKQIQKSLGAHGLTGQANQRRFDDEYEAKGKDAHMEKTGKTIGSCQVTTIAYDFEKLGEALDSIVEEKLALVSRSETSISTKLRNDMESKLTDQAIKRFQDRASAIAKQFGMKKHTLRDASVSCASDESNNHHNYGGMRTMSASMNSMRAGAVDGDEAEAFGFVTPRDERLTVTVSGTIQLS